jgi:hypothetical protein
MSSRPPVLKKNNGLPLISTLPLKKSAETYEYPNMKNSNKNVKGKEGNTPTPKFCKPHKLT